MQEITPVKIKLNQDINNIKLYVLSDVHIGSAECDLNLFKKTIEFIKNTPDMYVILLGDILDTALKTSKTDIYSEVMTIADAQKLAIELLTPIKDKIIGMAPGNHENRVWRETGIDLSLWLAEKLGVQDNYRVNALAMSIDFGKDNNGRPYKLNIFGQHGGYGGGRKLGSAMNAIEDMDGIVANADIYLRAHTHSPIQGSRKVFNFNNQGNLESKIKNYFNAPSFLLTGGYGLDISPYYINVRAYCEREDSKLKKYFKIDRVMM